MLDKLFRLWEPQFSHLQKGDVIVAPYSQIGCEDWKLSDINKHVLGAWYAVAIQCMAASCIISSSLVLWILLFQFLNTRMHHENGEPISKGMSLCGIAFFSFFFLVELQDRLASMYLLCMHGIRLTKKLAKYHQVKCFQKL